mmetsp:Transcript_37408/g.110466  ORF Transcript_37408/g.110466 Transcript_37408/m.110466 type:complete len:235 (-) Transcript_37408:604-1308(-)
MHNRKPARAQSHVTTCLCATTFNRGKILFVATFLSVTTLLLPGCSKLLCMKQGGLSIVAYTGGWCAGEPLAQKQAVALMLLDMRSEDMVAPRGLAGSGLNGMLLMRMPADTQPKRTAMGRMSVGSQLSGMALLRMPADMQPKRTAMGRLSAGSQLSGMELVRMPADTQLKGTATVRMQAGSQLSGMALVRMQVDMQLKGTAMGRMSADTQSESTEAMGGEALRTAALVADVLLV